MSESIEVQIYESVADVTGEMLLAAREHDWERLAQLEQRCADFVQQLKSCTEEHLSGPSLQRKIASIKKILADDREIRNLVDPWMVKLSAMISSNSNERRLGSSYRQ